MSKQPFSPLCCRLLLFHSQLQHAAQECFCVWPPSRTCLQPATARVTKNRCSRTASANHRKHVVHLLCHRPEPRSQPLDAAPFPAACMLLLSHMSGQPHRCFVMKRASESEHDQDHWIMITDVMPAQLHRNDTAYGCQWFSFPPESHLHSRGLLSAATARSKVRRGKAHKKPEPKACPSSSNVQCGAWGPETLRKAQRLQLPLPLRLQATPTGGML